MLNKFATILFIFLQIFREVASQVSIIKKDFLQYNCLSSTNGTWQSLDDGLAVTNCNNGCYLKGSPSSPIGLLIDTRLTVSGNIVYSYNIGSLTQYAVIVVDVLYYINNGAYLKIDINSQVSQTFNPGSQSLYDDAITVVCSGQQQYIQKASISLNRGSNQLINNNLQITFSKIISSNPNTSILGIKSISVWLSCSINCKVCSNELNCQSCKNGFKLFTLPSGQIVCQQTQGCSNNCYLCAVSSSENVCAQCKPGYQLSNSNCVLPASSQACAQGQYFESGSCIPYSQQCTQYYSGNSYGSCAAQETLAQYSCPYEQYVIIYPDSNHSTYRCGCKMSYCIDCYPVGPGGSCNSCDDGYNFSPQNTCQSICNSNQYLSSQLDCIDCGQNCIKCNQNGCLQCTNSSYYIDSNNQQNCIQCQIDKCSVCSSNGKCSICNSGYQLSSDFLTCQPPCASPNCATCLQGSSTNCQTCNSQYIVNPSTNQCISINSCIVANCQTCVSQNPLTCSTCSPNFYQNSDSSQCLSCAVQNCLYCLSNNYQKCSQCNSNFYLNSDKSQCLPCNVANCFQCISSNYLQCQKCVTGYYLSIDQSQCKLCSVSNCATCQDNNYQLCKTCQSNYYISADQQNCISCTVPNCNLCATNLNLCQTCNNNFFLSADQSQCLSCQVNNCQQCTGSYDKCQNCYNNFYLTADQSQCLSCQVNNCQQCIGSYDKCQNCQNNFYITADQSQCLSCQVNNCQQCIGSYNKCQNCQNNFYLNSDQTQCLPCGVANCSQCISNNYLQCQKCVTGYYLSIDQYQCELCGVSNCTTCQDNNYLLCKTCQNNYYNSADQKSCVACTVPNCNLCGANQNICQACNNNFYLSADQSQCLPCQDHLINAKFVRITIIQKQISLNAYLVQYIIVNNVQDHIINAKIVRVTFIQQQIKPNAYHAKCQKCQNNFYLTEDQSQCLTCQVNNCQQCDGAYNKCLKCINNFLPNSDSTDCQICQVKNCQQCSSQNYNICQQCSQNYYLNSSETQCQSCGVQNCKQCFANNYQLCQICNDGYQISSDKLQCTLAIIPTPQQNSFQIKQQLLDNGYNVTINFKYQLQQNSMTQSQLLSIFSISISGFTQDQYIKTLQQQSNSTITIIINPSTNIKNSKINVTIVDKSFSYQNSISVVTQTQDLIPYVFLSESQIQVSQKIASVGQGISITLISSIIPSMFLGNIYIICNTLDITGFLYYLMFLNIRFPLNIVNFYELFKNFNFPFVPNLFSFIVDPNYYQESPPKFMEMNTDNYFLNNSGQYFTIYLAGFGLYLLAKIFSKTSIKYISSYCQRAIKETWEYGAIIDLSWSFYIYLVVGILIQFKTYNFDDKNSYIVNYIFHSLCFIVFFGVPFFYLYKIYKNQNISIDKDFQTKYSSLINGLKLPEIPSDDKPLKENEVIDLQNYDFQAKSVKNENQFEDKNFNQIFNQKICEAPEEQEVIEQNNGKQFSVYKQEFTKKRTKFTSVSPQISDIRLRQFSSFLINFSEEKKSFRELLIYKFILTPFKSKYENVQFITQEILMIVIQICASLLVKDSQDENEDTRMKIGWIIVAISGFLIAYFTLFIIKDIIVSIFQLVKSLIIQIKNKKSKSKVQPAILNSIPIQINKEIDQNIFNNGKLDKNLGNNEDVQSTSIIYQTPNVQKKKELSFFLKHLQKQSQPIIYTTMQYLKS
ncbi:hypothetical protein TTHERM_000597660 (macronuclear) [Tetrahymena thermophila SB210]|uniref:EGF-like domain-containing protein n=1 Tax=Tetrahymena thermophila (strain SB210) TaxID=312017 RepID=W7XJJ9_TETTS|nr:hypothetical protein TTHERM_000597660 [Tetrahymena thermophila SB210]EWS75591.1 hypothetical protein TTHERM_000597660 [Tetrahymena thermophila SB210]|eukprot:XP_012651891.1 hypothetical protein TTHERM_000597660 [Tetrahymena thermophila SB210]